jgi:diketogulonate reductase-like aldo/keto reductase
LDQGRQVRIEQLDLVEAIGAGYRLIDTAASHLNEEAVGKGLRNSGVPRDQLFVVIGAGSIGQAIARRVSAGKRGLLADWKLENTDAAAKGLSDAGFEVSSAMLDVS